MIVYTLLKIDKRNVQTKVDDLKRNQFLFILERLIEKK